MRTALARAAVVTAALLIAPRVASAEWQIKPFLGMTFGGATTLLNPDQGAGEKKLAFGVSGLLIGEVFGIEGDFGRTPGFFGSSTSDVVQKRPNRQQLVLQSGVTTLTGNVVAALPRSIAAYSLRPYVVAGAGLMSASTTTVGSALAVNTNLPAMDVGGGVTGFLTARLGVSWDLRYFRSIGQHVSPTGDSIGPEELSFWRLNMALAIRY
jgi:hypothetical protein